MGLSLDWSREIATCDPGILPPPAEDVPRFPARRAWSIASESWVNWDPVDSTVLANEQVIDGRGWRSGALVEKRQLAQWFLRITDYRRGAAGRARRRSTAGPSEVRLMQENWIGRSEGARLRFALAGRRSRRRRIEVFTTRPDTLFGASFLALVARPSAGRSSWPRAIPGSPSFIAECRPASAPARR